MPTDSPSTDAVVTSPGKKPKVQRSPGMAVLIFLRDVLVILAIAIVVSFLVKTFLIRSFYIPSASMENTLMGNPNQNIADKVIVNELVPDIIPVAHGDVIVFKDPGGWLPARPPVSTSPVQQGVDWVLSLFGLASPDNDGHLIKRVIGLAGDTVVCCTPTGQLTVNGIPLIEPYIKLPEGVTRASEVDFTVTVPAQSLWVMGDNRYNSLDSRFNVDKPGQGFVTVKNVVGRAFVVSWPIQHWKWLSNYPETFALVPEPEALTTETNTTPTVAPRN
jgi:signal peptidase I